MLYHNMLWLGQPGFQQGKNSFHAIAPLAPHSLPAGGCLDPYTHHLGYSLPFMCHALPVRV